MFMAEQEVVKLRQKWAENMELGFILISRRQH